MRFFSLINLSDAKNFEKIEKKYEKAPAKGLIFLAICIRMDML